MSASVLLVEDDEFTRGFARIVLMRAGFEVLEAEDVAGALHSARSCQPAAVVTDWNLPDGNGGALARSLHEQKEHLPVILMTGDAAEAAHLTNGTESDFSSILSKPFPPSALENAVRAAIEHR